MHIGIIGYGIVGKAVEYAFKDKCHIAIYDPAYPDKSEVSLEAVFIQSNFIFISVPTPMTDVMGGPADTRIIDSIMSELNILCNKWGKRDEIDSGDGSSPIIIIKSAVLPSCVKKYVDDYPKIKLIISPEYLMERDSYNCFVNAELLVLGGKREYTDATEKLFNEYSICKKCNVGHCDAIGAAILKYMENSFLSTKVIFMNQFYDVIKASGATTSWDDLMTIFHYDSRMGNSHYKVPGPDGDRGFGGKCVPGTAEVAVIANTKDEYDDFSQVNLTVTISRLYEIFNKEKDLFEDFMIESCDARLEKIEYKKLLNVTKREINEEVLVFETENGDFTCTKEHLMPVFRDGKIILIQAKDIKETDRFFSK